MRYRVEGPKAFGIAENPRGDCQGVGGKVESPRGTNTPGVEELPQGDETSRVTPKGNIVPEAEGQGQVGDINSPANRDTEGSGNNSCGEEMAGGQEPAAPLSPQRGTAEVRRVEVSTHRHPYGGDSARPNHGMLARCKYGLLVPEDTASKPDATEPQGSGDSTEDTLETGHPYGRETGIGERNGRRALIACGQPEDEAEERGPPKRQRTLNVCGHQGGGGGGVPPTQKRALPVCGQGMEGVIPTRLLRSPNA